jgi:hypothetical protein
VVAGAHGVGARSARGETLARTPVAGRASSRGQTTGRGRGGAIANLNRSSPPRAGSHSQVPLSAPATLDCGVHTNQPPPPPREPHSTHVDQILQQHPHAGGIMRHRRTRRLAQLEHPVTNEVLNSTRKLAHSQASGQHQHMARVCLSQKEKFRTPAQGACARLDTPRPACPATPLASTQSNLRARTDAAPGALPRAHRSHRRRHHQRCRGRCSSVGLLRAAPRLFGVDPRGFWARCRSPVVAALRRPLCRHPSRLPAQQGCGRCCPPPR